MSAVPVSESQALAAILAKSKLIPADLQGKEADVLAIVLTGQEMGLSPMQSLRGIYIVKGRAILAADTMVAMVRRSPECAGWQLVELTDQSATYETTRRGDKSPTRMSYTLKEAQAAGLTKNPIWSQHPKTMLRHRAAAMLAREVYPDLVLGLYETGEGDEIQARHEQQQPRAAEPEVLPPARPREVTPKAIAAAPVESISPAMAEDMRMKFEADLEAAATEPELLAVAKRIAEARAKGYIGEGPREELVKIFKKRAPLVAKAVTS